MKTVVVIGIDKNNYNYKKIEGFINGFKKLNYEVFHYTYLNKSILNKHSNIDLLFAETEYLDGVFENVQNFILWANTKILDVLNFAKSNTHLKMIFTPKSFMFDTILNEKYIELFSTTNYQMIDHEGQDLDLISELISTKEKVNETTYKVLDNLFFSYMPCSKSELVDPSLIKESKYKFSYFGTGYNRPQIMKAFDFLNQKMRDKIKFHYVEHGGPIHPNDCLSFYRESEYVLHEQVNPVILEYPVRLGEASASGAKIILFEPLPLYETVKSLEKIPELIKYNSVESFIKEVESIPNRSIEERKSAAENFKFTYDSAIQEIQSLLIKFD